MNVKNEIDRRTSNTHRVLQFLKEHGVASNTQLQKIGGFRYGARLKNLRDEGHIIVTNHVKDGLWEYVYRGQKQEITHRNQLRPFEAEDVA